MDKKRLRKILNGRDIEDICESIQQCYADMEDHHSGYYPDKEIAQMSSDTDIACTILRELVEEVKKQKIILDKTSDIN